MANLGALIIFLEPTGLGAHDQCFKMKVSFMLEFERKYHNFACKRLHCLDRLATPPDMEQQAFVNSFHFITKSYWLLSISDREDKRRLINKT